MNQFNFTKLPTSFEYIDILDNNINKEYKQIIYDNIKQICKDNVSKFKIDFTKNKLGDIILSIEFNYLGDNTNTMINNISLYFDNHTPFIFSKGIKVIELDKNVHQVQLMRYEMVD